MSDETITVCPECDDAQITRATPSKPGGTADGTWFCSACRTHFDDPHERERKSNGAGHGTVYDALVRADPEDLPL